MIVKSFTYLIVWKPNKFSRPTAPVMSKSRSGFSNRKILIIEKNGGFATGRARTILKVPINCWNKSFSDWFLTYSPLSYVYFYTYKNIRSKSIPQIL